MVETRVSDKDALDIKGDLLETFGPVRRVQQILSVIFVFCLLVAGGHVMAGHGGAMSSANQHEETLSGAELDAMTDADAHEHESGGHQGDTNEHEHDLTGAATCATAVSPSSQMMHELVNSTVWIPLLEAWTEQAAEVRLREAENAARGYAESVKWSSDDRAEGWLLDCHTARPVRGPSLTA